MNRNGAVKADVADLSVEQENKNGPIGSLFDDYLVEQGTISEVHYSVVKQTVAIQLARYIKQNSITKTELAKRLRTSRAGLDNLLNPESDAITLKSMLRVGKVIGKQLRVDYI